MLVTGGSRGIGAATAVMAAGSGYDVAISYVRDVEAADQVVDRCAAAGVDATAIRADVAIESDVVALFESCDHSFGRLDAVVNNAGILHEASRLAEFRIERLQEVVAVNVVGAILVAREAVRRMSTRREVLHSGDRSGRRGGRRAGGVWMMRVLTGPLC